MPGAFFTQKLGMKAQEKELVKLAWEEGIKHQSSSEIELGGHQEVPSLDGGEKGKVLGSEHRGRRGVDMGDLLEEDHHEKEGEEGE